MTAPVDLEYERDDPLAAATGIINGLLISLVFWALIGCAVWMLA